MKLFVRILALTLALGAGLPAAHAADPTVVRTASGRISGVEDGGVTRYTGIRYAAPPMGARRWTPPEAVTPWSDVYAADRAGPSCPQPGAGRATSEDCLFLNVWVPKHAPGQKLPVMVWSYGGGFLVGAGSDAHFDGSALARRGVIVVTFNYRLNTLGFLAHPQLTAESPDRTSGNYAMLDAFAALQWVQKNIGAFGGNPSKVTAFGESSGAILLANAMIAPKARGLFQQVILQSGGQFRDYHSLAAAEALGTKMGDVAALRALPAERVPLLGTLEPGSFPRPLYRARMSGTIIDGRIIPSQQHEAFAADRFLKMPMLLGNNRDEGSYATRSYPVKTVAEYQAYLRSPAVFGDLAAEAEALYPVATPADIPEAIAMSFSDVQYNEGSRSYARGMAAVGQPVYRYQFTRRAGGTGPGPNHGDEVVYVFNTLGADGKKLPYDDADRRLAEKMADAWVRFAKTGNPNGGDLPQWDRYSAAADNYLDFGDTITAKAGYRTPQIDFVEKARKTFRARP